MMEKLTEKKLFDFAEKAKKLFHLEGSTQVEKVYEGRRDALVVIGNKKFAVTLNSEDKCLVAGYGAVEEAEFIRHGVWKLTQNGKTYCQNILEEWATVAQ